MAETKYEEFIRSHITALLLKSEGRGKIEDAAVNDPDIKGDPGTVLQLSPFIGGIPFEIWIRSLYCRIPPVSTPEISLGGKW